MKKTLLALMFTTSFLFAQSKTLENIETAGDYILIALPLSAWITTLALDDTDGQIDFYKSFGATFVTTQVLKYTVREKRPESDNTTSFPSGHTSTSFQGASFIHFRYGWQYAVVPYIGAVFVAYSRVAAKQHYVHDVIAGALIGSGFAWYFTKPYKVKGVEVEPIVFNNTKNNQNLYGVRLTF